MGHLGDIRHPHFSIDIFTQREGKFGGSLPEHIAVNNLPQGNHGGFLVGDLNTDRAFSRNRRFNMDTGGRQRHSDIAIQSGNLFDAGTELRLKLIPGHGRTAVHLNHLGLHAVDSQHFFQISGRGDQIIPAHGVILFGTLLQQGNGRKMIFSRGPHRLLRHGPGGCQPSLGRGFLMILIARRKLFLGEDLLGGNVRGIKVRSRREGLGRFNGLKGFGSFIKALNIRSFRHGIGRRLLICVKHRFLGRGRYRRWFQFSQGLGGLYFSYGLRGFVISHGLRGFDRRNRLLMENRFIIGIPVITLGGFFFHPLSGQVTVIGNQRNVHGTIMVQHRSCRLVGLAQLLILLNSFLQSAMFVFLRVSLSGFRNIDMSRAWLRALPGFRHTALQGNLPVAMGIGPGIQHQIASALVSVRGSLFHLGPGLFLGQPGFFLFPALFPFRPQLQPSFSPLSGSFPGILSKLIRFLLGFVTGENHAIHQGTLRSQDSYDQDQENHHDDGSCLADHLCQSAADHSAHNAAGLDGGLAVHELHRIQGAAADDMKQSGKQHQQHIAGDDLQPEGLIQLSEEIQESHKQRQNRNQISAEAEDSHEETVDGQADDSQRILQKDSQRQKENHQHNQPVGYLQPQLGIDSRLRAAASGSSLPAGSASFGRSAAAGSFFLSCFTHLLPPMNRCRHPDIYL